MAHILDPNHPCVGKSCEECETCIFDMDIDEIQPSRKSPLKAANNCGQLVKCFTGYQCDSCEFNEYKNNSDMNECCNKCPNLIKNFLGDDRLVFNACCGKVIIDYGEYTRPRVIKYKTGQMLQIDTPDWCPKKNGIDKQVLKPIDKDEYADETNGKVLLLPSQTSAPRTDYKHMSYYDKKEEMRKFTRHLTWDEIKENEVFVVPKILNQSRKVFRVVSKTNGLLRYCEIDEDGKEKTFCGTLYPSDIELVFITKLLKY